MKTTALNLAATVASLLFLALPAARAVDRDYIEDTDFTKTVAIVFSGATATVTNGAGVTVTYGANSSYVAISSAVDGVQYSISGTSSDGYVQITSTYASKVLLNGLNLTSSTGPAISTLSAARNFIVLGEGTTNALADSATGTRTGTAALYASGPLILSGKGSLTIAGLKSHGIASTSYIRALGGDIQVTGAVKDAIHSKTFFQMDGGTINATATGDGIDGDTGYVAINGGSIAIRSTADDTKGIVADGTITINGGAINLTATGAQSKGISSKADVAVNGGSVVMNLSGNVVLVAATSTTGTAYTDPAYCAGIKTDAAVNITGGSIAITHTGTTANKGITNKGNITISGGTVDISTSGGASAAYTNSTGVSDYASSDCLTTNGTLTITGGTITTLSTGDAGDGITSDLAMSITGGTFNVTNKGARSKGINANTDLTIGGGNFTFTMSGAVVLETVTTTQKNPDYCTAIKVDGSFYASNGTAAITHSGLAGKGISVDGAATFTGGTFNITTSGGVSATYTNTSNTTDIAASDCIKVDGALTITAGTITATATGAGGDAIGCDGVAIIGTLGVSTTPVISATASGARTTVSGSNYGNCKAFSAGGNLTMNGGSYTGRTAALGAEGLESKANLTINGGTVDISTYDDGINAATSITINGGNIYSYASNNDGIDSNGTIKITGGLIVSSGAAAPEEGFDCDNNTFTVTGGTMFGTGGASSTPTASVTTQNCVFYTAAAASGAFIVVKNSGGTPVYVCKIPRQYTSMKMLFSNATLPNGTYTLLTGATVTGGTEFHGYYTGATVTGGTVAKTFTISAKVTTIP